MANIAHLSGRLNSMATKQMCTEAGCEKTVTARGLCPMHYARAKKSGTLDQYGKRPNRSEAPCKLDGCENRGYALGYCQRHYDAHNRYGDPISPTERKRLAGPVLCSVDGCDRNAKARGMCGRHYENMRITGAPIPRKERPMELRLIETGWDVTEGGCWEWAGPRNDAGYGLIPFGGRNVRAHRVMYEARVQPIADGGIIRHRCDNPPCINPEHLIAGTHRANMDDMVERNRSGALYENNGYVCPNGHDTTEPGAYKIVKSRGKRPYRTCVTCARTRSREYARRKRAELSGLPTT